MGRPKDPFWDYVEKLPSGPRCKFCLHVFGRTQGITRLKHHLFGGESHGIVKCTKVPKDVQAQARNFIPKNVQAQAKIAIPKDVQAQAKIAMAHKEFGNENKLSSKSSEGAALKHGEFMPVDDNESEGEPGRHVKDRIAFLRDQIDRCVKLPNPGQIIEKIISYVQFLQHQNQESEGKPGRHNKDRIAFPRDPVPDCNESSSMGLEASEELMSPQKVGQRRMWEEVGGAPSTMRYGEFGREISCQAPAAIEEPAGSLMPPSTAISGIAMTKTNINASPLASSVFPLEFPKNPLLRSLSPSELPEGQRPASFPLQGPASFPFPLEGLPSTSELPEGLRPASFPFPLEGPPPTSFASELPKGLPPTSFQSELPEGLLPTSPSLESYYEFLEDLQLPSPWLESYYEFLEDLPPHTLLEDLRRVPSREKGLIQDR